MIERFERSGVAFQYPANWSFEIDEDAGDWLATLQTPGTALMTFAYRLDTEPTELADETLEAFQDDYPELDSEIAIETLADRTALGHDIDFLTLDCPVMAKVRAVSIPSGALLIFWQFSDRDREHYEPLFQAVLKSLSIES